MRASCATAPAHVPPTYGDYYLVETLLALERKK
jgi:hypothetical protein